MRNKAARRRIEVNLEELDRIIDHGTRAPISESDDQKIKAALHAMADRLTPKRSTEKTSAVLPKPTPKPAAPADGEDLKPGMGETAPLPLRAQPELRSRMPRSSPAMLVRNAAREKSTGKKNRPR